MPTPSPTKLLLPLNEAQEQINAQIKKGSWIIGFLGPDHGLPHELRVPGQRTFEEAEAEREKWAKFTVHLLKTLFTDGSIAGEFGGSWLHYSEYDDNVDQLEDWMKGKIVRLESIAERLHFFPLAGESVPAKIVPSPSKQQSKDIFIVHGHDEATKQEVARLIEKLGLRAVILHEQPDRGKTIIEKFELHSAVGFAVVLLTPDDVGYPKDKPTETKPRPRQNVLLELGYFIGILGRSSVCALMKGGVEIPTDLSGVLYTPMDDAGAWRFKLATEINAAGIDVDLNNLK